MKIDETDLEIIEQLKQDGRQSFRKIAKRLGVSTATVSLRFSRLVKEGVIKRVVPILDYKKLGKNIPTIISLKVEASKLDNIVNSLKKFEEIEEISLVDGEYNIEIKAVFNDLEKLSEFIEKNIQKIQGIISFSLRNVIKEYKK